jgi:hypothetical protein
LREILRLSLGLVGKSDRIGKQCLSWILEDTVSVQVTSIAVLTLEQSHLPDPPKSNLLNMTPSTSTQATFCTTSECSFPTEDDVTGIP